jgi:hypothetical protein
MATFNRSQQPLFVVRPHQHKTRSVLKKITVARRELKDKRKKIAAVALAVALLLAWMIAAGIRSRLSTFSFFIPETED